MSDHTGRFRRDAEPPERALLDEMLGEARLYRTSQDYLDLLDFVGRSRDIAPFNAMLLQIQKPGLTYAASVKDWKCRFQRSPKEGSRPLLIMRPFGPVALVYDVTDTDGAPLPRDAFCFPAAGDISPQKMDRFDDRLLAKGINVNRIDSGDGKAGLVRLVSRADSAKEHSQYEIQLNRNHERPVQFVTLAHELAHLFMGHLGADGKLGIAGRSEMSHERNEIEAESVAYILAKRQGLEPRMHPYSFVICGQ